ncbi:hypothetical protein PBY51_017508 [Eleginops maclovinus]|uniref:G-protein signaling modulator 3 n=1 Tax=Eleginops maclovinus TaxID=56733 RepID=A0AAN8AP15_ELEMC|nr:hypothetical protein PBY51_017508 [Eleginops maclovinus]
MAEEGLLERLVITEEEDMAESVVDKEAATSSAVILQSCSGESILKEEEEHSKAGKNEENITSKMCLEEKTVFVTKEEKPKNLNDGQNTGDIESEGQTHVVMRNNKIPGKPSDTEDENVTQNDSVDVNRLNVSEKQRLGIPNQEEDPTKAHRLTPDFPEALYELLFTLQEGRRLNDQRCSFRLEGGMRRRRCHSEPSTNRPANRVVFSSMTSLQKEEFFDLLATAQARRLDDQRAQLEKSQPPKSKARGFRGSIRQLSFARRPAPAPAPVPVPKEDLYNMILTTQAQGRLEDQRSRAPGPMDDDDFFSLLLRVQGGRMDEQRTELPGLLQA